MNISLNEKLLYNLDFLKALALTNSSPQILIKSDKMLNFDLVLPTRIIFGIGAIERIGSEAKFLGKKAFIITGKKSSKENRILEIVIELLTKENIEAVVFSNVEPNPSDEIIDEAGKIARDENCDFVIGIGGGSAMDSAKGVAVVAKEGENIWNFVPDVRKIPKRINSALPIVEIPTLSASGSEVNGGAVISNPRTKEKILLRSFNLFPKFSIIDPSLTITVPPDKTGEGGIDIICHVLDPYLTNIDSNTPLQERFQESIIKTVMENLPRAIEDGKNLEARTNLAWCAVTAVSGFPNSGENASFPMHAIEHPISAIHDISHGRGLSALILPFMEFVYEVNPERLSKLAEEVFNIREGNRKSKAKEAIKRMREWLERTRMLTKLRYFGVKRESFHKIADDAIRISGIGKDYLSNFPQLDRNGIIEILEKAF
ncbi:MAG: iron-containing alcohol dehydrogenase [Candidatus Aminicenantia bacterium]